MSIIFVEPKPTVCMLFSFHREYDIPTAIWRDGVFRPVRLPVQKNPYMESWTLTGDWSQINTDWIGHITYNYNLYIPEVNFQKLVESVHEDYDGVGLYYMPHPQHNFYEITEISHPGFMQIWARLIDLLGYGDYKNCPMPYCIYRNYWILKKKYFDEYCELVKRASEIINTDSLISEWAMKDSTYPGKVPLQRLNDLMGRPYYTFHGFIIERLIGFYTAYKGLKMALCLKAFEPKKNLSTSNVLVDH